VQLQLVLSLGAIPDEPVAEVVARFLTKSAADPDLMRDAAMSCLRGRELEFAERLLARSDWVMESPDHATTLTEPYITLAEKKGCTPGQLALAWVLAQGKGIVPIPGTKRRKYLEENVAAVQVKLSSQDLAEIDQVWPRGAAAGPRYSETQARLVDKSA